MIKSDYIRIERKKATVIRSILLNLIKSDYIRIESTNFARRFSLLNGIKSDYIRIDGDETYFRIERFAVGDEKV